MIVNLISDVVDLPNGEKMTTGPMMVIVVKYSDPEFKLFSDLVREIDAKKQLR